ncbi:hypothetical protein SMU66_05219 [Streptococcus mutans N34]|nr:hypothetical protein SMU66_05219 [Streptococcus mutans N34]
MLFTLQISYLFTTTKIPIYTVEISYTIMNKIKAYRVYNAITLYWII